MLKNQILVFALWGAVDPEFVCDCIPSDPGDDDDDATDTQSDDDDDSSTSESDDDDSSTSESSTSESSTSSDDASTTTSASESSSDSSTSSSESAESSIEDSQSGSDGSTSESSSTATSDESDSSDATTSQTSDESDSSDATTSPDTTDTTATTETSDTTDETGSETTTALLSFAADIQPILNDNCGCHLRESPAGGLSLAPEHAYDALLEPGNSVHLTRVSPGLPDESYLINKLEGTQDEVPGGGGSRMPPREPLPQETIDLVREWISQGARP